MSSEQEKLDFEEMPPQTVATMTTLYLASIMKALDTVHDELFKRMLDVHRQAESGAVVFMAGGATGEWLDVVEQKVEALELVEGLRVVLKK